MVLGVYAALGYESPDHYIAEINVAKHSFTANVGLEKKEKKMCVVPILRYCRYS